jgi:Ni/Co efflux regulator RcnB
MRGSPAPSVRWARRRPHQGVRDTLFAGSESHLGCGHSLRHHHGASHDRPATNGARRTLSHHWRARRLYAPAPGYGWVKADSGDYLLVALTSGLIANIVIAQ